MLKAKQWIAKDKNGEWYSYGKKPKRQSANWGFEDIICQLKEDSLPEEIQVLPWKKSRCKMDIIFKSKRLKR